MGKIIDFNEIKSKKEKKKYIIYGILVVIFLYIIYAIYLLAKSPTDTVTVESGVLTQEESATGYIIRDETVVKGENYKNGITPILSEGERAAKGETIFRYSGKNEDEIKSKIEEIDLKLQEAMQKEKKGLPTDIKNIEKQIDEKTKTLKTMTDIQSIAEIKKEISNSIIKKAQIIGEQSPSGSYIKQLTNQRAELEKELNEGSEYMKAPKSGVVSYRVDGLENILSPEDFSSLTQETLENLGLKTGKIISTSSEEGKVINNFECYIATILNSSNAKDADVGDKIKITLSSGNECTGIIEYISKQENDNILLVIKLDTLTDELLQYRKISFNITWWSVAGLKVPNSSIIEDSDGLKYVVRQKSGYSNKVLVKVLKKNEKFSLISTYTKEELDSLGVDSQTDTKIILYDKVLLYPDLKKVK